VSDQASQLERLTSALASRYRIERELGHGGMATVYLAEDLKHHRQVAVKVLRPELAAALGGRRGSGGSAGGEERPRSAAPPACRTATGFSGFPLS
jgi:hypothetical protein